MERANCYLSDKQVKQLRDVLLAEKERIFNKELENARYCLDKNELSDQVDEASVNIQAQHELRIRNRENFYVKKVGKAIARLDGGTYGLCDDCDAEISFERLMARPTAELCINCKEEREVDEKNNFFAKKSKSLGKTMSEIGSRR